MRPVPKPRTKTKEFPTTQVAVEVSAEKPEDDFVVVEEVFPPHSVPIQQTGVSNRVELPVGTPNRERDRVDKSGMDAEGDEVHPDG